MTASPTRTALAAAVLLAVFALGGCGKDTPPADGTDTEADHDHGPAEKDAAEAASHADHGDDHADEGPQRTIIPAVMAEQAGIRVAAVAAGTVADEHDVQGLLTPVDGRVAQVMARFPGPIRTLRANVGDSVKAGQVLASIDSNLSLSTYTVSAPISGVVLARQAQVGGVAGEGSPLFEIGDLSTLWVDLHIFGNDTQHITAGVPVTVSRMTDGVSQITTLERVLPGTATASQSTVARASLRNDDGLWRPGAAVKARIVVATTAAAQVVPLSAVQTLDGKDVVFVRNGDTYTARPVRLGARDAQKAEVLEGLRPGEDVVVEQSYVIKADIGKAGAAHEH